MAAVHPEPWLRALITTTTTTKTTTTTTAILCKLHVSEVENCGSGLTNSPTQYRLVILQPCFTFTNCDLCHLEHKLIGFYNRDEKSLQRSADWAFK
jgi:hypothetical protein